MSLDFKQLQSHGTLYPLFEHFSRFFWLHPELVWMAPELRSRLFPALAVGVDEGLLIKCARRPWYACSPLLLDRLRGQKLRAKQWQLLREGPGRHTSMIHRVAATLRRLPPGFLIHFDEGVTERSPPAAWGGFSQRVPDVLVRPPFAHWPALWIECERNIKSSSEYRKKLSEIGSHVSLFYVTPNERVRISLLRKWPDLVPGRQTRIRVMTEVELVSWLRKYSERICQSRQAPQMKLNLRFSKGL